MFGSFAADAQEGADLLNKFRSDVCTRLDRFPPERDGITLSFLCSKALSIPAFRESINKEFSDCGDSKTRPTSWQRCSIKHAAVLAIVDAFLSGYEARACNGKASSSADKIKSEDVPATAK